MAEERCLGFASQERVRSVDRTRWVKPRRHLELGTSTCALYYGRLLCVLGFLPKKTLCFQSVALQRASHSAPCRQSPPGPVLPPPSPSVLCPASPCEGSSFLPDRSSWHTGPRASFAHRLPRKPLRPRQAWYVPLPSALPLSVRFLPAAELTGIREMVRFLSGSPTHRDSVASCLAAGQEPGRSHQASLLQRCSTNDKLADHGQFHFTSL